MILRKFRKIFEKKTIFGVVTDLQIDFLNGAQLCPTFGDLILIELVKGFNLPSGVLRVA